METKVFSKRKAVLLLSAFLAVCTLGTLYLTRESRAAIICTSLDDGIRPRNHCIMNPFRDRSPELAADAVLQELKNGNVEAIGSIVEDRWRERFFNSESEFRVISWRIGNRSQTNDKLEINYWVRRANYYDIEESVNFFFVRNEGEWRIKQFTATY